MHMLYRSGVDWQLHNSLEIPALSKCSSRQNDTLMKAKNIFHLNILKWNFLRKRNKCEDKNSDGKFYLFLYGFQIGHAYAFIIMGKMYMW